MKKIFAAGIIAFALTFSLFASAQDYRSGSGALVSGVVGYPSHAESPAAVAVTGTTAKTTAIPAYTYVRIYCTAEVSFKFGDQATITATTSDPLISNVEVFNMGPSTGIAFIAASGTATCHVTVLR